MYSSVKNIIIPLLVNSQLAADEITQTFRITSVLLCTNSTNTVNLKESAGIRGLTEYHHLVRVHTNSEILQIKHYNDNSVK